jgi:hypothetical protein
MCFRHLFSLSLSLYIYIYIYKVMVVADKLTEYPKSLSPRHSFLLKHFLSFFHVPKMRKGGETPNQCLGGGPNDPHFTLLITIVPERFRNKLNYFSFCLIFEK